MTKSASPAVLVGVFRRHPSPARGSLKGGGKHLCRLSIRVVFVHETISASWVPSGRPASRANVSPSAVCPSPVDDRWMTGDRPLTGS